MLKKIISFTICLALLCTATAFAEELEFIASSDNELGVINISGKAPAQWGNRKIAVMVSRPEIAESIDYDTLDEAAFVENVYTIGEAMCSEDGSFQTQIKFGEDTALGYYLIRVGATGIESDSLLDKKVLFATKADALAVLNLVNSAKSGEDVKSVINGTTEEGNIPHNEILSLDISDEMYEEYPDAVASYIYALKGDGFTSLVSLQEAFRKSSALTAITYCDNSQTIEKIEEFAQLLNIDISKDEYTKNKEATALLVKSNIEKLPEYETEPEKFFAAMSSVAAINSANRETVMDIVEENKENLDITLGEKYEKLSSYEVGKALVGKNFADVESVQEALYARIDSLSKEDVAASSGGGGGGGSFGGSGGGAVGIVTGDDTLPAALEETENTNEGFNDVSDSHWAYTAVNELSKRGIISGMGDGSFLPDGSVKREEIAKMVVLAFGFEPIEGKSFDDVDEKAWYSQYIASAYESGIVNGIGEGKFGIGKNVSRQDLTVMLYRALLNSGHKFTSDYGESFSDNELISSYAKEAVGALYSAGMVNGSNGNFEPLRMCTRAEAAKLIYEATKQIEKAAEEGIYEN